jgi:hypothetical protein
MTQESADRHHPGAERLDWTEMVIDQSAGSITSSLFV